MTQARFTSLMDNKSLARLERLRIQSLRQLTSRLRGEHLSGKGGASTEFVDFRDYVAGDDIRSVDWNIFARIGRPYVKLFRMEEEMHVLILVDASASMAFEGKLERAKQLALAFATMGLMNLEPVSIYSCHHLGTAPRQMARVSGRMSLRRVCSFLESLEGGGDFPIERAVDSVLATHRGRGVAILLSDFLTFGDLERPMNLLYSAGLEPMAVQILGPGELRPDFTGDLRLVDSETSQTLDISSAGDLMALYADYLDRLQSGLGGLCRKRSGRFLTIDASAPLETVLFDLLRRRGWVR